MRPRTLLRTTRSRVARGLFHRKSRRNTRLQPPAIHGRERGQMLVLLAFAIIAMFALAGLAVDGGRLYVTKAELSRSVDAAALSGVLEFNGTQAGLSAAQTKAEQYFNDNEPSGATTFTATANGDQNQLTVDATKKVNLIFLRVLGINSATVSAHAKASFGTKYLDASLVIDSTNSMVGNDIKNAKAAALNFKDTLLGTNPSGNTSVGVTPFRGCYRANPPGTPQSATAPMPFSKSNCVREDTQVTFLTSDTNLLTTRIDNIDATGGSGTNLCNGLAKGWEILDGPNNHLAQLQNQRILIILSDGGDNYTGSYVYQTSPFDSPHTYRGQSCRPPQTCDNVPGGSGSCGSLNSNDSSGSCNQIAGKRARQLDIETWEMAQSLKADGVTVYVVAFGVCQDTPSSVYTDAQCQSQIGNTDVHDIGDQRLLKCIASSSPNTNDHYFWASSSSQLPAIFTKIATQISIRLVE